MDQAMGKQRSNLYSGPVSSIFAFFVGTCLFSVANMGPVDLMVAVGAYNAHGTFVIGSLTTQRTSKRCLFRQVQIATRSNVGGTKLAQALDVHPRTRARVSLNWPPAIGSPPLPL